jgi:hypothetical protein
VRRELIALFRGALLSPLVIVFVLPVASFVETLFQYGGFDFDFALRQTIPTLFFAYLGMLIFAPVMYLVLRAARSNLWFSILLASIAGFFAPSIIPVLIQIVDSPQAAFQDLRVLFTSPFLPSLWFNSLTVTGMAVGIAFLFIARPGPALFAVQNAELTAFDKRSPSL